MLISDKRPPVPGGISVFYIPLSGEIPAIRREKSLMAGFKRADIKREFLMGKKSVWGALLAAALVCGMAMIGCQSDDGGGGGGGLPGLPGNKSASDLPGFGTGIEFVGDVWDAQDLLTAVAPLVAELLEDANGELFEEAFKEKNDGKTLSEFMTANDDKTSISIDAGTITGETTDESVSITGGKSSGKWSSNVKYGDYVLQPRVANDYQSLSRSIDKTFVISPDFVEVEDDSSNVYKVAGFVTIKATEDSRYTCKKAATATEEEKSEITGNDSTKISVALTVIDTTNETGAKFLFTYSSEGSYTVRQAGWSGGNNKSSVQVYDGSNALKYTMQDFQPSYLTDELSLFDF
jgi:hypothetical protein